MAAAVPGDALEVDRPRLPRVGRLVGRRPHLVGAVLLEQLAAPVEDADVRAEELVGRADEEVAPERRDVDRAVRRVVDGVDVGERARLAAERGQPGDVVDRPGAVRRPAERGDTRAPRELRGEVVDVDDARLRVDAGLADGDAAVARRPASTGRRWRRGRGPSRGSRRRGRARGRGSARRACVSVVMLAPKTISAPTPAPRNAAASERASSSMRVAGLRGHERPAEVGVRVAVVGLDGRRRPTGAPGCRRGCRGRRGRRRSTGSRRGSRRRRWWRQGGFMRRS